jgi:hypothetical protein
MTAKKSKISQKGKSNSFFNHVIQAIFIFSSVFLAFWLTEIREKQRAEQIIHFAFTTIAAEMTFNHSQIVNSYEYYLKIINYVDSLEVSSKADLNEILGYQIPGWQGLKMPMLRSSGYQALMNSGVVKDIPFETQQAISFIYTLQSFLERIDYAIIESAISDTRFSSLIKVKHIFILYTDLLPDVLATYQSLGKKFFSQYGYTLELKEGKLKDEVEEKKNTIELISKSNK